MPNLGNRTGETRARIPEPLLRIPTTTPAFLFRVHKTARAPLITTDLPIVQTGEWHSLRGHRHAASEPTNCLHPSFLKRCRSSANVMTDRPKCITIQVSASLCLTTACTQFRGHTSRSGVQEYSLTAAGTNPLRDVHGHLSVNWDIS